MSATAKPSEPRSSLAKIVVMAAPNGARRGYADHPAIPLTARESAESAAALAEAGVSVLHLHVRDRDGRHSIDPELYREAISEVRKSAGPRLVIQVTSEAVGQFSPAEQMAMVRELKPEAVSLSLKELCPDENAEAEAGRFFAALRGNGTWPQYILYSSDELERFDRLRRKGFFGEDQPFCLLVLGRYSSSLEGDPAELSAMLDAVNLAGSPWAACCFGRQENAAMLAAAEAGGHVRLGFENNLVMADGSTASDNTALIRQFVESSAGLGREPATSDDVREIFNL